MTISHCKFQSRIVDFRTETSEKWRKYRSVTGFLPPPLTHRCDELNVLKSSKRVVSTVPPSIIVELSKDFNGGCAPYDSRCGVNVIDKEYALRTWNWSIYTCLLPRRPSTCACVAFADVLAENPIVVGCQVLLSKERNLRCTNVDLPEPVGPQKSIGYPWRKAQSSK